MALGNRDRLWSIITGGQKAPLLNASGLLRYPNDVTHSRTEAGD